ncbi:MAG TPA: hypothetical protein VFL85_02195 [Candidatus Saccharimonadales bacterium]|nr:hypothetical protein [Candidatus Saccharimonadales bacterium]
MREKYSIKYPRTGLDHHSLGIVLVNHAGSNHNQDSGRDAQMLADAFHTITINADRPTSYRLPRSRKLAQSLKNAPVKTMYGLAQKIENVRCSLKLKHMIIAGRSAGGLGALELAQTNIIHHTDFVYAAEPIGCVSIPVREGYKWFRQYDAEQRRWLSEDEARAALSGRLQLVHPPNDLAALPPWQRLQRLIASGVLFFMVDRYYNRWHWSQPLVSDYLSRLTLQHHIRTHVDFAAHSLVLPEQRNAVPEFMQSLAEVIQQNPRLLSLNIVDGTTHASFNNRSFFARRLQRAVARQTRLRLPAIGNLQSPAQKYS